MYTSAISLNESGKYQLSVYDSKSMKLVFKKEKPTYESARKEHLTFMYVGTNVSGGGSGDGSNNGRRRKPKPYVDTNDSQM